MADMDHIRKIKVSKGVKDRVYPQGRWSRAQHDRFIKGLEKYGRNWVQLQQFIKSRSVSQVRSHAQKYFLNMTDEDIEAYISKDTHCKQKKSHHLFETEEDNGSGVIRQSNYNKKQEEQRSKGSQNRQKLTFSLLQVFKNAIDTSMKQEEEKNKTADKDEEQQQSTRQNRANSADFKRREEGMIESKENRNGMYLSEGGIQINKERVLQRKLRDNGMENMQVWLETSFF